MPMNAMSLSGIYSGPRIRSKIIYNRPHSFKMFGVKTFSILAQMIDFKTFWNRTYKTFM